MRDAVVPPPRNDAGFPGNSFGQDERSQLQWGRSCKLDQVALIQIRQRFAHIAGECGDVGIVFFGQRLNDLGY